MPILTHIPLNRPLIIAPWLPWPTGGGIELRVGQTVAGLASRMKAGIATLTARPRPVPPPVEIRSWESPVTRLGDPHVARSEALRWLRDPDGHPSDVFWSEEAEATMERALEEFDPDVVVLDSLLSRRALPLVRAAGRPVIYNAHNHEARLSRALVGNAFGAAGPTVLTERINEHTERVEEALVGGADQLWVCSERDADAFREDYERCPPVRVVPNGVELGPITADAHDAGAPTVLFPGVLSYPPNQEAALFLVREVFPLVREKVAGARLVVLGAEPPRELLEASRDDESIEVTGAVEDAQPYFRRASVLPVPLFSGSGTRYKILEAFAAGVPVVSTAKGIEGIDARPGEDYLPAETGAEFAAAIERLCERQELRAELRKRGRELVERRYSQQVVADRMVEAIAELGGDRGSAPSDPRRAATPRGG